MGVPTQSFRYYPVRITMDWTYLGFIKCVKTFIPSNDYIYNDKHLLNKCVKTVITCNDYLCHGEDLLNRCVRTLIPLMITYIMTRFY